MGLLLKALYVWVERGVGAHVGDVCLDITRLRCHRVTLENASISRYDDT